MEGSGAEKCEGVKEEDSTSQENTVVDIDAPFPSEIQQVL